MLQRLEEELHTAEEGLSPDARRQRRERGEERLGTLLEAERGQSAKLVEALTASEDQVVMLEARLAQVGCGCLWR